MDENKALTIRQNVPYNTIRTGTQLRNCRAVNSLGGKKVELDMNQIADKQSKLQGKRNIIFVIALLFLVVGFFVARDAVNERQFKKELANYVEVYIKKYNKEYFIDYQFSGSNYQNLLLTFDNKFNQLDVRDQFRTLKFILNIYDSKRRTAEKEHGKYNKNNFYDFAHLTVNTSSGNYGIDYQGNFETPDGKKYTSNDFKTTNNGNISTASDSTLTAWNKPLGNTNGNDWIGMTRVQKSEVVLTIMINWENSGSKVLVDNNWFISELDNYYGNEATNKTDIAKAMSLIAASGKVVK